MRNRLTGVGLAVLTVAVALILPTGASAASTNALARADCKSERIDDPGEFKRAYGSGAAAIARCAKSEIRQARRECRRERRIEKAEFKREFGGTGKKALRRCVRHEVR